MLNKKDECDKGIDKKHSWAYLKHQKSYVRCMYCKEIRKTGTLMDNSLEVCTAPAVKSILSTNENDNRFLIVVPVYNAEKWIKKCVESITN